jgi:hypothetical protein
MSCQMTKAFTREQRKGRDRKEVPGNSLPLTSIGIFLRETELLCRAQTKAECSPLELLNDDKPRFKLDNNQLTVLSIQS